MMECSCFDFGHFGVEKKVITLQDFVHFVDAEFSSFADVLLVCTIDVVTGLDFLHRNGIAHRDLKPGNTLVCNKFYKSVFYKSVFYKSSPCFTNPIQSIFYNMPYCVAQACLNLPVIKFNTLSSLLRFISFFGNQHLVFFT